MESLTAGAASVYTEELLKEIQEYASLMFTRREIAAICEITYETLCAMLEDRRGVPFKTFQSGRLKEDALIRRAVFDLAKAGSSPAQTAALRLIELAKMDDL